jgi:alpha-D-ribose 1-methylphosphonate 5-triphosphate synthase subunit PhnL
MGHAVWQVEENATNRAFVGGFLVIFRAQLNDWNVLIVNAMAQGTMGYVSQLVRSIP